MLIGASIASVVGVPLGKAVSDAWRWEDALLLMAVLSALALAMVIRWIHVPEIEGSQLQSTLSDRLRAVCRPDIVRTLLSYLLIFGGIMAVFSYLATFLVRYTQFPTAYITPVLALYGVADIVGNLILSRRIPSQLEGMFKRLLIVLAISLTAISLLGASVWMIPFVIAAVGSCHAAAGLMTGIDVLRRAGANAQLVGAFNVSAINVGIMLGAISGGLLIDHIGLAFIGCLGGGFVLLALLVRARLAPA